MCSKVQRCWKFCVVLALMMVRFGAGSMELRELNALRDVMIATGNVWITGIEDPCADGGVWHGIACEEDESGTGVPHVVSLSFGEPSDYNRYTRCSSNSTISPSIGELRYLRKLSFFSCCFLNPQPIPRELELLNNTLESLVLTDNGHTGSLPPGMSHFSELIYLNLHGNSLNYLGVPPEMLLHKMTNLKVLDLSSNELQGSLNPEIFNQVPSLTILDLSHNNFRGSLPPSLGSLKSLKKLDLSYNKFSGEVPSSISGLRQLEVLDFGKNSLTGALPPSVGDLSHLKVMILRGNSMNATITPEIGSLGRLQVLDLSISRIVGVIPDELGNLLNLRELYLDGNDLSGPIPSTLELLPELYELRLESNNFVGPIPFSQDFLHKLGTRFQVDGTNQGPCPEGSHFISTVPTSSNTSEVPQPRQFLCSSDKGSPSSSSSHEAPESGPAAPQQLSDSTFAPSHSNSSRPLPGDFLKLLLLNVALTFLLISTSTEFYSIFLCCQQG